MSDSEIFKAAVKLPPDRRQEYLDEACGENHELRREVESLLRAHDPADSFLERPAAERIPTHAFDHASGETVKNAEDALDFLAPSDKPECLGTIGQYEIAEVVGRGGMGIVLKGYDPKLSRVVAVKVLAPELASNASARKRFLREGRAAAAVSHDHVVTIYGIDDGGTLPFIAMEYISGPSLEDRIKAEGSLELTEILRIGMQIASGLAAAHAQGLVHRDVKPGNILLENGVEKVKITDFGLARAVDDVRMTKPGVVTGTPEYMSPEQARGESVDHRTDLFSLGSVLYAMCTGRSPFRAENTVAMIRRVCEDTPRPIDDVNPEIPGWLIQIIDDLLSKSPADRFQSAAELAELLGQCLAHLQQPSVNPLPERLEGHRDARAHRRRATTRRRGWLAAAAVLLVAIGGLSLTEATGVTDVAGTVIRIVRGDGTLVVRVDDPEVSVSIDGEQLVITGAGPNEIRLGVGQHELKAVKDGEPVHTESVTITRDGKRVVEVNAERLAEAEVARVAEPEATAGIELQETWPYAGMDELKVLAISRDGRYCAFTDAKTHDLVVRDLTTREDRQVTEPTAGLSIGRASISPDNKWVAYGEWDGSEWSELRIVGIDGGEDRVLCANEEKEIIVFWGWDSESRYLLATSRDPGVAAQGPATYRIVTISVADGSIKVLKEVNRGIPCPRLSPDGRYIAYSRKTDGDSNEYDVFLIPLDGDDEIHLIEHPAYDYVLGWIPDSQNLLFFSNREGQGMQVWMIRVVDGRPEDVPRRVTKGVLSSRWSTSAGPVRTPTGGWAFYYRESGEEKRVSSIYTASLDPETGKLSTAPELIAQSTAGKERVLCPDFSHDGKYLAYYVEPARTSSPTGPTYLPGNIIVRSLETGAEREVTLSPQFSPGRSSPRPRWHPDGQSILVHGYSLLMEGGTLKEGRCGNYRVDLTTGKLEPVVLHTDWIDTPYRHKDNASYGEFSPDGAAILYGRHSPLPDDNLFRHWRVIRHDLKTGEEKEICLNPEGEEGWGLLTVSPDEQRLLIATVNALWIAPIDGGEPRELLKLDVLPRGVLPKEGEFSSMILGRVAWTPDSRYVLFLEDRREGPELWRIAADGGEPELLDRLRFVGVRAADAGMRMWSLRVHPDGRQIAFNCARSIWQDRMRMMQINLSGDFVKEINLQTEANHQLTEPFSAYQGNNLAELPQGEQVLGGVKFNIGVGCIQLNYRYGPAKVEGIAVGRSFRVLHILHGTVNGEGEGFVAAGTPIGEYRVHYDDGGTETIPIIYGEDVRDWWDWGWAKAPDRSVVDVRGQGSKRLKLAWRGTNELAKTRFNRSNPIRLFLSTWENPRPDKRVTSIDYVATYWITKPFCVAMSVGDSTDSSPLPLIGSSGGGSQADVIQRPNRPFFFTPRRVIADGMEEINLAGVQLTDSDLVHLEGLTDLKVLHLAGTPVGDAGLVHLRGLSNLQRLDLNDTRVTEAGVAGLQTALPDCLIKLTNRLVELTSPSRDANFEPGESVLLKAKTYVTGSRAKEGRVEFLVDGSPLISDKQSPFEADWLATTTGRHVLTARGFDKRGREYEAHSVTVFVGIRGLERFIESSADDAEEYGDGGMTLYSSDLDLMDTTDSRYTGEQKLVGMRFADIRIPRGAQIQKAYLQFTAWRADQTKPTKLTIHAELAASAKDFGEAEGDISSRARTKASVEWSPAPWEVTYERSEKQRTPDLSSLIQEVVAQPDWCEGNALVLIISGSGERGAVSFDGRAKGGPPMLYVEH